MNTRKRIQNVFLVGVFICYIILLIKVLFLSRVSLLELFDGQRVINRSVNLIPFYSIWDYLFGGSALVKSFAFGNVVGNIVLFIPLGIYLPLFKKDDRIRTNLLLLFIVSFVVEILQGLFGIGAADIDDIMLNCLGGCVGILLYKLSLWILRDENKVRTAITIVAAIIGLPVLYYLMFRIKMRF